MKSLIKIFKSDQPVQPYDDGTQILYNPDGSYLELEPMEQYYQSKIQDQEGIEIRHTDESRLDPTNEFLDEFDDQEIQTEVIPTLIESVLDMLVTQQCNIICIVILHLIFNVVFTSMAIYFRKETINKLNRLYQDDYDRAYTLYYTLLTLDIFVCTVFYALAISAYCKKSIGLYQLLMKWIYICFFVQVLLAYINKLNIILVFLMVLTYVYAKFIGSLIRGLVTLPRLRVD